MKALHVMACIFLLVYAVYLLSDWDANWMEIVAVIPASLATLGIVIFKGALLKQLQINQVLRLFEVGFLGVAANYFYTMQLILPMAIFGVVALFILVLMLLENKVFSERFIELNEQEIIFPQLLNKRKIPWQNITGVVLRFHVLTLEMKDDSFVQQAVFHKYDDDEIALFDDFLKRQLA